jgi:uncharacterized protein (TIGR03435 family)
MGIFFLLILSVFGQAPVFDAVSIHPSAPDASGSKVARSGRRIDIENSSLREIIAFAYGIPTGRDYQLIGPDWLDIARFDITATYPSDTSRDRVPEMLQTMLIDRFGLKTHNENRKLESYVLTVGRRGPKLQPDTAGAEGAFIWGEDRLTARAITMAGLANRLSGPTFKLGRPVVDMTGIQGDYDFTVKWGEDTSMFTALQEQLDLRLQAGKAEFPVVVVDHVEKIPTAN